MSATRFLSVAAIGLCLSMQADAGGVDIHGVAPPAILQMDSLPNAGNLMLEFCLIGKHVCVERSTSCHGQCCNQSEADAIGYGCSGTVDGLVPPLFRYRGWHCQPYGTPTYNMPLSGDAGLLPGHEMCGNR